MNNTLSQLKQWTHIVADTGNLKEIIQFKPEEATTNPTLILKAFDDRVRHKAHTPAVPAVRIMQQHLHEKISVAEIAKHFGISENYFRLVFEEHWGTSPVKFITDLRIRRAKTFLLLSDKPIIEIAMACGFYDSSHFSNVFLKKVGYTPSEYRKKHSSF